MEKKAVYFLNVEQARERLNTLNDDQRYKYIQVMYRSLPSNLSMSVEEFNQLASEFAPTFKPSQDDNQVAVTEHAARPDTLNAVRRAQPQVGIDFLGKIEYIAQGELSDDTRKIVENLIEKVTTHYIQ